jgi:hypothetical protein
MILGVFLTVASTSIRILEISRSNNGGTLADLRKYAAPLVPNSIVISDYNLNFTVNYLAAARLVEEGDPAVLTSMMLLARFLEAFVAMTTSSYSTHVFGFSVFATVCSALYGLYFVAFFRK